MFALPIDEKTNLQKRYSVCLKSPHVQISNLAFIYTCAEILLFYIKPNIFLYIKLRPFTLFLKFSRFVT